jgi:hypothetical protein
LLGSECDILIEHFAHGGYLHLWSKCFTEFDTDEMMLPSFMIWSYQALL